MPYSDAVRDHTLEAIRRIARGQAISAGLPDDRLPVVTLAREGARSTYNDPVLTRRLAGESAAWIGQAQVLTLKPVMAAEDFALYGRTEHKIPICMVRLGSVSPDAVRESGSSGRPMPSLHSPFFAPLPEPTIRTGILTMTASVLELMAQ